ncbi:hypothetical protein TYRP_002349 [Tyrophagus putrescentiae]|nr:hypothetical protein TYRP_002349 [Tyrophagus putrescentiae]
MATRLLSDHRLSTATTSTSSLLLLLCCSVLFCWQLSVVSAKYHHHHDQYQYHHQQNALQRGYRAVADNECRYDKGPWQECDALTGKQKRILTMRSAAGGGEGRSAGAPVNSDCPSEKFIERPCKKQCKYSKGVWSECTNGAKERVDKLKAEVSTSGCKPEKAISKQCKKQCAYEKSEWSICEGGVKTKTLTLVEGGTGQTPNSVDCEPTKTITKVCLGKHGGQAGAATNKQQQKRFRKQQQQQLKNREQVS